MESSDSGQGQRLGGTAVLLLTLGLGLVPVHGRVVSANSLAALVILAVATTALRVIAASWPLPVLAVTVVFYVIDIALSGGGSGWSYLGAVLIALFFVARHTSRLSTCLAAGAVLAAVLAAQQFLSSNGEASATSLQLVLVTGCAAAFGDAARSRHDYILLITEQARQAERSRESEANRRVAEERLRIARDLHDALAHQIAVINLNSSVAARALRTRPVDAEESLAVIGRAARTVLTEISGLMSVLRTDRPTAPGTEPRTTDPVPGLSQIDQLLTDFRHSGLDVEKNVEGTAGKLSEPVDIVAYRLIQEALTNAHKHGDRQITRLDIQYREDQIQIIVVNGIRRDRPVEHKTGGYGLVGARERAASVGGTVTSTPGPGLVHRFAATLPVDEPAALEAAGPTSGSADR